MNRRFSHLAARWLRFRVAASSLPRPRSKPRRTRFEPLEARELLSLPPAPPPPGDANNDSVINIFDVNVVSANWGTSGPAGDVNGDGHVDVFDINSISANWGTGAGAGFSPIDVPALRMWYNAATTQPLTRHGAAAFDADQHQFLSTAAPGPVLPVSQMTVSFWMNQSSLGTNRAIVNKYNAPGDGSWAINTGGSITTLDELWVWIADGPNVNVPYATTFGAHLLPDRWYHVAMVFDGTQADNSHRLKVYIDGVEQDLAFIGSTVTPVLTGDVNHDGSVDIFDINLISSNWGNPGGPGDANLDGNVDIFDINLVSTQWYIPSFTLNSDGHEIPAQLRQTGAPLALARPVGAQGYFDGSLTSLGIFDSALSSTQVAALFNNGNGQEYGDLSAAQKSDVVAWWELEEPTGTTRVDATGGGWNLADTTTVAQRQIVSQWRASGIGPTLEQTYTRRPDYAPAAINGLGAVYFDGVDDVLRAAVSDFPSDRAGSVFVVVRLPVTAELSWPTFLSSADEEGSSRYFFFSTETIDPATGIYDPDGEARFRIRWRYENLNVSLVSDTVVLPETTYLVNISSEGPTAHYMMRVNGVAATLEANPSLPAPTIDGSWYNQIPGRDTVTVGALDRSVGPDGNANAYIGEIVVLGEGVTEQENLQIEAYLAAKWGVTLPAAAAGAGSALRTAENTAEGISPVEGIVPGAPLSPVDLLIEAHRRGDLATTIVDLLAMSLAEARRIAVAAALAGSSSARAAATDHILAHATEERALSRALFERHSATGSRQLAARAAAADGIAVEVGPWRAAHRR